jgi:hypothetical protein
VKVAAAYAGGGPVLAPAQLGTAIPALTDAVSWVGHPIWTRDYVQRKIQTSELFGGAMDPVEARRFVLSTGTRALVAPCGSGPSLRSALAPLGFHTWMEGCAVVYVHGLGRNAPGAGSTVSSHAGHGLSLLRG